MYLNLGKGGEGGGADIGPYRIWSFNIFAYNTVFKNIAKIKQVNRYITKVKS